MYQVWVLFCSRQSCKKEPTRGREGLTYFDPSRQVTVTPFASCWISQTLFEVCTVDLSLICPYKILKRSLLVKKAKSYPILSHAISTLI